jgi:hypothetical protein
MVNIELLDINGRDVAVVFSGMQMTGTRSIEWNKKETIIPAGVYLLRFAIKQEVLTQKIIIY